ncbi:MAG TPA: DUF2520 domain-containing protein [Gemmatimonadaceae bacterium]|nr:DUF2520 domain-containing protein [Gemmatimonadaceae bacterium]
MVPRRDSVAIVGAGAMGAALARALDAARIPVAAVASRRMGRAESLAAELHGSAAVALDAVGGSAPVILLTVSDSAIEEVCASIRPTGGALVAHVSGFRDVGALEPARTLGARVGSMHPLAAVARGDGAPRLSATECVATFQGAAFAIEGDDDVARRLSSIATALGGNPFPIVASDKPLYHLGASMLAAFAGGLTQITWDGMRKAGAPNDIAISGSSHLLLTVARNIARTQTPADALTGPVARGDADGVRRQAQAAGALSREAQDLYRMHAAHNIALVHGAGRIDDATAERLRAALRDSE